MYFSNNRLTAWEKIAKVEEEKTKLEEENQRLRIIIKDLTSERDRFKRMWEARAQEEIDRQFREIQEKREWC